MYNVGDFAKKKHLNTKLLGSIQQSSPLFIISALY